MMWTTRIARTSLAAAAVAAGLLVSASPALAGGGVRVGFSAAIVAPPLVISLGNAPPALPYAAPYGPVYGPNGYYVAPGYAPYAVPYVAPYAVAAPVVVAPPVGYVRVWVPGPHPHWMMRPVARGHYRRW